MIDFKISRVADMSAKDALNKITLRYAKVGNKVVLRYLSQDCRDKLEKAKGVIVVAMDDDPTYKVVSN